MTCGMCGSEGNTRWVFAGGKPEGMILHGRSRHR